MLLRRCQPVKNPLSSNGPGPEPSPGRLPDERAIAARAAGRVEAPTPRKKHTEVPPGVLLRAGAFVRFAVRTTLFRLLAAMWLLSSLRPSARRWSALV